MDGVGHYNGHKGVGQASKLFEQGGVGCVRAGSRLRFLERQLVDKCLYSTQWNEASDTSMTSGGFSFLLAFVTCNEDVHMMTFFCPCTFSSLKESV